MAFVVEDGTGLDDSNAYIDVAFADEYFSDSGNTTWGGATEPAKQAAIVQATAYIDTLASLGSVYGTPVNAEQALVFPRNGLPPCAGGQVLPKRLQKATAEYAVRALSGPLLPDPSTDPSGYAVKSYRTKVGPLEEETEYATGETGGNNALFRSYPAADALLACLFRSVPGSRNGRCIRN